MREGPYELTVVTTHCTGCKHHSASLTGQGRVHEQSHVCYHPQRCTQGPGLFGEVSYGRNIGKTDETPRWCPYLKG